MPSVACDCRCYINASRVKLLAIQLYDVCKITDNLGKNNRMGGLGSGRRSTGKAKPLVERQLAIRSRCIRRLHLSGNNSRVAVPVEYDGKICVWADGQVEMESGDELVLTIYLRGVPGEPVAVDARARSTPCRFGGVRWWFECNQCAGLVQNVYLSDEMLSCRKCLGLVHRSTRTSHDAARYFEFLHKLITSEFDPISGRWLQRRRAVAEYDR